MNSNQLKQFLTAMEDLLRQIDSPDFLNCEDYKDNRNLYGLITSILTSQKQSLSTEITNLKKLISYQTLLDELAKVEDLSTFPEIQQVFQHIHKVEDISLNEEEQLGKNKTEVILNEGENTFSYCDDIAANNSLSPKLNFMIDRCEYKISTMKNSVAEANRLSKKEEEFLKGIDDDKKEGLEFYFKLFHYIESSSTFAKDILNLFQTKIPFEAIINRYALYLYEHQYNISQEKLIRKAFIKVGLDDELEKKVLELEDGIDRNPLFQTGTISQEAILELYSFLNNEKIIKCRSTHFLWALGGTAKRPTDFTPINFNCRMTLLKKIIQICGKKENQNLDFWEVASELFTAKRRPIKSIGLKTDLLTDSELDIAKKVENIIK